jgi:hypothetical protein
MRIGSASSGGRVRDALSGGPKVASFGTPTTIIRNPVEHSNAARPSFREYEAFKTVACGKEPLRLLDQGFGGMRVLDHV